MKSVLEIHLFLPPQTTQPIVTPNYHGRYKKQIKILRLCIKEEIWRKKMHFELELLFSLVYKCHVFLIHVSADKSESGHKICSRDCTSGEVFKILITAQDEDVKKKKKREKERKKNLASYLLGRKVDFPVDPFPAAATLTYSTLECWRGSLWKDIASLKCSAVLLQKEMLGSHCPHPLSPEFGHQERGPCFLPPLVQWFRRKFSPLHPWMFKVFSD